MRDDAVKFAEHDNQAALFFESQSVVEQAHIVAAFRFELSKCTVPAIRERVVSMLRNVSSDLARRVAQGLGMPLPDPMPRALARTPRPEVTRSASLSLLARPGDGGIRTRKVAVLVADGVDGRSVARVQRALRAAGAVPRLVGVRIGPFTTATGDVMHADASMENEPAVLFDALVLPDGSAGVKALQKFGQTLEFVKDTYRHCKAILAVGESRALLQAGGTPCRSRAARPIPGSCSVTSSPSAVTCRVSSRRSHGTGIRSAIPIPRVCRRQAHRLRVRARVSFNSMESFVRLDCIWTY